MFSDSGKGTSVNETCTDKLGSLRAFSKAGKSLLWKTHERARLTVPPVKSRNPERQNHGWDCFPASGPALGIRRGGSNNRFCNALQKNGLHLHLWRNSVFLGESKANQTPPDLHCRSSFRGRRTLPLCCPDGCPASTGEI